MGKNTTIQEKEQECAVALTMTISIRPSSGIIFIIKKDANGNFAPVYNSGNGIGGYDLKSNLDQGFAFDYDSSGKMDHLVLYRPSSGIIFIIKKDANGNFSPDYEDS